MSSKQACEACMECDCLDVPISPEQNNTQTLIRLLYTVLTPARLSSGGRFTMYG